MKMSIKQMEEALGLHNIRPIQLTLSDAEDMKDKDGDFKEWYEYELRKLFEGK